MIHELIKKYEKKLKEVSSHFNITFSIKKSVYEEILEDLQQESKLEYKEDTTMIQELIEKYRKEIKYLSNFADREVTGQILVYNRVIRDLENLDKEYEFNQIKKITPTEMLNFIISLTNSGKYLYLDENKKWNVSTGFIIGGFAECSFTANHITRAVEQLVDYFYENKDEDNLVGIALKKSGFPNLNKVREYHYIHILLHGER